MKEITGCTAAGHEHVMSNHCCSAYEEYDIICCNAVVFGICAKAAKLHKPLGRILNGRRRGREVLYLKILSVSCDFRSSVTGE